jgi:hypothetical protein
MFRAEYLVTFEQKDSYCNTIASFNRLIEAIDGVVLSKSQLHYEGLTAQFEVQTGEIRNDRQRYFHLKLSNVPEENLDRFEKLQRAIRSILTKATGKPPQSLWDGIGTHYAQLAYPRVHDLENTLRKLITKFMLTSVGLGWTNEAIPREVVESIRAKESKTDHNYLFQVDFIQLSNFLFKEYPTLAPLPLIEKLRKAERLEDLDLTELKQAIPRSNWDRYFSTLVNCDSEYLRVRWERLYERRNQVAHNRPMSKSDYEEAVLLCEELMPKLQQAIDSLDKVTVSDDDRERVSENAAASKSPKYQDYLQEWNLFHRNIYDLVSLRAHDDIEREKIRINAGSFRTLLNSITRGQKAILREDRKKILELFILKNMLLHQADVIIPESTLDKYLDSLRYFNALVQEITQISLLNSQNFESNKLNHELEEFETGHEGSKEGISAETTPPE